ncbi:hypothetical protein ACKI2N_012325 [Cupriavidus sp. 30B13]|uniref:hypothetical protein n=1 Tax=Cupriavidus sp. 30B13 TaxID=3384241 RepID=UPI003B917A87
MADQNPYLSLVQTDESNPYAAATAEAPDVTPARLSMMQVAGRNPDTEARLQALAKQYSVPTEAIRLEQPDFERRATIDSIDYATLARDYPATAGMVSDPQKAAISYDDTPNLSAIEKGVRFLANSARALGAAVPGANEAFWGVAQAGADTLAMLASPLAGTVLPENPFERVAAGVAGLRQRQAAVRQSMMPRAEGVLESGWYSGMQSLGQMGLAVPAMLTGNPTAALGMLSGTAGGQAYGEARDKGVAPQVAIPFAVSQAAIEYATEHLPVARFLTDFKAGTPFLSMLARNMAAEIPGEQVATVLQDLNEWAVLNPDKPFSSYLQERPSAAAQTLIATLVASGGAITTTKAVQSAADRVQGRTAQAQRAVQAADALAEVDQLAAASKLRERAPESFREFVAQAAQDGAVQDVFIDANQLQELAQSGVDLSPLVAASPSVAEQIAEAVQTGGSVRIPVEDYATYVAGTETGTALLPHLKTDPAGMSRAEAEQFMQGRADELKREVEQTLTERDGGAAFQTSRAAVEQQVLDQLNQTKRFTESVNQAYATLMGSFYAVQAARAGVTPETLFQQYPVQIRAENVASPGRIFSDALAAAAPGAQPAAVAPPATLEQEAGGQRGSFNPATNTITLLKNADLSTFLHESGHFYLEVQFDLAAKMLQTPAAERTPGQQAVLDDAATLLKWFGIRDLDEWSNLDFEEKRSYHERFARGFEAYLFEGKAPNIQLQGVFQRFRAWLLNVYQNLKALNVELDDSVRGVFDRMLASADEIKLLEQGRSMLPLFASAAQAGMTEEEFAAYQNLGVDASNTAIQELQARGLRDMRWLHNARGREIKRLQKEAAARRAEIQMEVRREVMSQPIYRAWQFLTGKPQAAPTEPTPEQVAYKEAVAEWEKQHTEAADSARQEAKRQAWEQSAEAKAEYDSGRARGMAKGQLLARMKKDIDLVVARAVLDWERANPKPERPETPAEETPDDQHYGKFDLELVRAIGVPKEVSERIKTLRMTGKDGLHPDVVSDMIRNEDGSPAFSSGDELVRSLAAALPPRDEINALTDQRMLERYGEMADQEAIERAADEAVHNDARARMIATEANALAKALGEREATGRADRKGRPITRAILPQAARQFAESMIARLKVREIRPSQYSAAETRAARAAQEASRAGDLQRAVAEKRNQLVNAYATRAAFNAQEQVESGLRYLRKFANEGTRKGLDADYTDQIDTLLERFDLRQRTLKDIDRSTSLAEWLTAQREQGLEPDVPQALQNEAFRKSFKDMTVDEFRGLVDTVKQIEHLGRLKHRLLTAQDQRSYEAIRDEIAASIEQHAGSRAANTRTPTTNLGRAAAGLKRFWSAHIKAATWARVLDGGRDGGPVWEYFVRSANIRGDSETTMRADATAALSAILSPVFKLGRMGGKGVYFPSIDRSLNREARLAIALNTGNASNLQRLLGGEGWTLAQIQPVLQSLTAQEWRAVQAIWDHFESYRPRIAEKEKRVYGKEPEWVEPQPFQMQTADGQVVDLRGGYYPIKYDPAASQRAEEHADAESAKRQLQGAYTSATTRRSFTKARVDEVTGRPLLYSLAGLYSGVNDVIHDLAWHEWLIDANRLLRSKSIDGAIRRHYGPEAKQQLKTWAAAIAEGEQGTDAAVDQALSRLRQGVSVSGLGFNVMSAAMQPLGITQSIVRVGAPWIARGVASYIASPIASTREVNAKSDFMANRARTRFRELNELRNQVQDQSAAKERVGRYAYFLMMRAQQMVDMPTWLGAYEKAIADGNAEDRAIGLADQAVIDAQGGGQTKDLSAIERGGPAQKLFTVFYSFMNTTLNAGVAQTMTADTPAKRARLAVDYALLYVAPAVLGFFLKEALTPGGGGDDWEKLARKLLAAQIDYLMGLMVVVREFGEAAKTVTGANDRGRDYTGPAGLRMVADSITFAKQAHQGEFDDAFRKSAVNVVGDLLGLPSAQVNRTITGAQALADDKTSNPAALVFGYQKN